MSPGWRRLAVAAAAALPLIAAGCGEPTDVTVYQAGEYKGKTDSKPWANDYFASKTAWDEQIESRTMKQNDYARIGD